MPPTLFAPLADRPWSARASSAAPMFFRPIRLPSLGYCWDGGLMHNCPAALCVQELKHMWPWSPPLGVLLSVGTGEGSKDAGRSAQRPAPRLVPRHHFFWPLHDTLMTETDGALSWLRFASQGSRAHGDALCRLDSSLSGPAPPLDAVDQIDDLVQQARAQRLGETGRRSILRLLAQSLFFELASAPEGDARSGSFHCVGAIRYRISGEVFVAAFRRVSQARNQYVLNGRYLGIDMDESSICRECGRHCLPINFKVQRLQEVVQLSVRLDNGDRYPVGGFPNPMLWFMERQGFTPTFGLAGNGIALRDECQVCERRIRTRRGLRVMKLRARQKVRTAYAVCAAEHSAQIGHS
ncbi:predicted protein [Aspergillus terreus NIH2624]|uniref:PNPLA domain-containing protein n=1 Tax=Aspergillus terreus (strain NIH 2624 / FGSC A1156) TaxID=341663 RepID=Q0C8R8_ASPTN|nr:uncharacterized protein ATEG_09916 [Aspergillus terreus NIH2624]EAU30107.1 predicted protein [Aspergillus terreus NIH2624]